VSSFKILEANRVLLCIFDFDSYFV